MRFSRERRAGEFEAAALPHLSDIYRTATRLLGDSTRAEDVVQEVYLQADNLTGTRHITQIA